MSGHALEADNLLYDDHLWAMVTGIPSLVHRYLAFRTVWPTIIGVQPASHVLKHMCWPFLSPGGGGCGEDDLYVLADAPY